MKKDDDKKVLFGLLYDCPYKNRRSSCSLWQLQDLTFKEKIDWLNKQELVARKNLLHDHFNCKNRIEFMEMKGKILKRK